MFAIDNSTRDNTIISGSLNKQVGSISNTIKTQGLSSDHDKLTNTNQKDQKYLSFVQEVTNTEENSKLHDSSNQPPI
jgi:hypothetical protein